MRTQERYIYDDDKDELYYFSFHKLSDSLRELFSDSRKNFLKSFIADHINFSDKEVRTLFNWGITEKIKLAGTAASHDTRKYLHSAQLKKLDMSKTNIGNRFFKDFSKFENLEILVLNQTHINDSGVMNLPENLRVLKLDNTEISEITLKNLGRFKKLESLSIAQFLASDNQCLDFLAIMPELKSLTLDDSLIGTHGTSCGEKEHDSMSANLEICTPNLEILSLVDCGIGSEDLTRISKLRKLSSLNLRKNPGAKEKLSEIFGMENLVILNLSKCDLSANSFREAKQSTIRTLNLSGNEQLDLSSFNDLSRLRNVFDLNLSGCRITSGGLKALLSGLPLAKLKLEKCQIAFNAFDQLESQTLEVLDVRNTSFSLRHAENLKQFPKLRHLNAANTPLVKDEISFGQFRNRFPTCLVNTFG